MNIQIKLTFKKEDYEIIKQEKVDSDKDDLVTGIYRSKLFKDNFYIICCNRLQNPFSGTLEYTKFSKDIDHALKLYNVMLNEIQIDLNKLDK